MLLLFNGVGLYVYFVVQKEKIHREMKTKLLNSQQTALQKITLTIADYQRAKKEGDEIKWQGSMYDVARVERSGEMVIVFGLRDDIETELLAFFKSFVETNQSDDQAPPAVLMQYLSLVFTIPSPVFLNGNLGISDRDFFVFWNVQPQDSSLEIQSPPPRA